MDFTPSEAGVELAKLTKDILAGQRPYDGKDRFDRALWADLATAGVLAADDGLGLLEQCAVLVELGRAVAPVPYLESIVVAATALDRFGDDRWVAPAVTGRQILTVALVEEYGEDPTTPVTNAERVESPDDPGVTITPVDLVDLGSAGWLDLDSVPLAADRLVGTADMLDHLVTTATVGRCAWQVGVLDQALAMTAEHARTRVQFDRPIAAFQAVTQRLADAYIDVEAVRLTLWQAAWRVAAGLPSRAEVATAKFWAADAGHRVAHTAVHIHGGMGIDTDHPLHRYFIAAKRTEFELGSATTQLRRLGALLAEEPA